MRHALVVIRRSALVCALLVLISALCTRHAQGQVFISGFQNSGIVLLPSGQFSISTRSPAPWVFSGSVGAKIISEVTDFGSDNLGPYRAITFSYSVGASSRTGNIRAYSQRPVILFGLTYYDSSANTAPFPVFSGYPDGMLHLSFSGSFSLPDFPSLSGDSPWIYYDTSGNTFIISAASDYMVASTTLGSKGEIQAGISGQIPTLPEGLTHWTALVFDQGINRTFETWGRALTDLSGKKRPANDSDFLLRQISYWTDNGANYYYNMAPGLSYPDTFRTIQSDFGKAGIGLGSMQLDSWWYPKGPGGAWHSSGGIWDYTAAPDLFVPDLASVQKSLGIPLIAHARWIDVASPLRQRYTVSGNVATDPRYWEDTGDYFTSAGIQTFEQDWLGDKAHSDFNLTDPFAFMNNMAASMAKRGITMQYCMAEPKHLLQGTNYSNLTTTRASQDRFGANRWTEFLYSSRLASALGVFPFTDVFVSSEKQNLLFAVLSSGPVGIGDKVNSLSAANLHLAVRADGVIVKPDVPAVPADEVFIADAQKQAQKATAAGNMVASTYSDFGSLRTAYVVAYQRDAETPVSIVPATLGISGDAYVYDYFSGTGALVRAGGSVMIPLTNGFGYWIVAPVGRSGIGFLGDKGHFVTMGKKRIANVTDEGTVVANVEFAPGEGSRTIFGFSPKRVNVSALSGAAELVSYDPTTELFSVRVHPGANGKAQVRLSQSLLFFANTCVAPCGHPSPTRKR